MQFPRQRRRPMPESIVPMINVVFLLLIFFLMTAQIAPPPPFAVELPHAAEDGTLENETVIYLSAEGRIGFQGMMGEAAWEALAALPEGQALGLQADWTLEAAELARVMARLSGLGLTRIDLAVQR